MKLKVSFDIETINPFDKIDLDEVKHLISELNPSSEGCTMSNFEFTDLATKEELEPKTVTMVTINYSKDGVVSNAQVLVKFPIRNVKDWNMI